MEYFKKFFNLSKNIIYQLKNNTQKFWVSNEQRMRPDKFVKKVNILIFENICHLQWVHIIQEKRGKRSLIICIDYSLNNFVFKIIKDKDDYWRIKNSKILEYTYEFTSLQKISMKYIRQMKLKNQEIV